MMGDREREAIDCIEGTGRPYILHVGHNGHVYTGVTLLDQWLKATRPIIGSAIQRPGINVRLSGYARAVTRPGG